MIQTQISGVLDALIKSTTGRNQNIVRYLACVSNGDMRHALAVFRDFLRSGNTDVDKILRVIAARGQYIVPFHEFAKSAILGSKKYYSSGTSHVLNVYARTGEATSSHLTVPRVLWRLASAANNPSSYGPGYIQSEILVGEYRDSFGRADDLIEKSRQLLSRGLLESEPPRVETLLDADVIRSSAAGHYYYKYLLRSFAYVDLVLVDTAVTDLSVSRRIVTMAPQSGLSVRYERVRLFLDHLEDEEAKEMRVNGSGSGRYDTLLVPLIRDQIEREIDDIQRRTGTRNIS